MDKLPDIEQFAVDRLPSIDQFAVPAAIPASAPKRPPRAPAPEKSMAQTVLDPIQSFLRSTGQAASLGLAQYPAALGIQATRAVTGGAPLSFGEALQEVKQQNRQFQQENPTASTLGQLAGIVPTVFTGGAAAGGIPLVRSLTVGAPSTSMAAMTGRGALYGGVQGFTENESLTDAGAGAILGGALSGTLGTAGRYATSRLGQLGEKEAIKSLKDYVGDDLRKRTILKSTVYGDRLTKEQFYSDITDKEVREFLKATGKNPDLELKNIVDSIISSQNIAAKSAAGAAKGLSEASPVYGALAGFGAGGAAGVQDPLTLALLAGAGGLGVAKSAAVQEAAKSAVTGLGLSNMLRPGVGNLYSPGAAGVPGALVGEAAGRAATAAMGPYVSPPSRLQQLADDFRQEFGGR